MNKPTFESLMNMNAKELADLRTKSMDAAAIMRQYNIFIGPAPKAVLGPYDFVTLAKHGINAFGAIGAAAVGFLAVKYYTDKKYKENEKVDARR